MNQQQREAALRAVRYLEALPSLTAKKDAALLRSLAEEKRGEPVAYRYTWPSGHVTFDSDLPTPGDFDATCEALYTHPPAKQEPLRECGWIAKDGFPALLGNRPLKPGAKLYANPADFHGE